MQFVGSVHSFVLYLQLHMIYKPAARYGRSNDDCLTHTRNLSEVCTDCTVQTTCLLVYLTYVWSAALNKLSQESGHKLFGKKISTVDLQVYMYVICIPIRHHLWIACTYTLFLWSVDSHAQEWRYRVRKVVHLTLFRWRYTAKYIPYTWSDSYHYFRCPHTYLPITNQNCFNLQLLFCKCCSLWPGVYS
jgi:hypothetical protein